MWRTQTSGVKFTEHFKKGQRKHAQDMITKDEPCTKVHSFVWIRRPFLLSCTRRLMKLDVSDRHSHPQHWQGGRPLLSFRTHGVLSDTALKIGQHCKADWRVCGPFKSSPTFSSKTIITQDIHRRTEQNEMTGLMNYDCGDGGHMSWYENGLVDDRDSSLCY